MLKSYDELIGKQFGCLLVTKILDGRDHRGLARVECKCACGATVFYGVWAIKQTKQTYCKSCKTLSPLHITKHPLYSTWRGIKGRCNNQNNDNYKNYGGRGITICDEWVNNPKVFIDFMVSLGWEKNLEIDRINVNGNYEPSNVRLATRMQNSRNTRGRGGRTSKYKGVVWSKKSKTWKAQITCNLKTIPLGTFNDELQAAYAYDIKAKELFKEFAYLNFPDLDYTTISLIYKSPKQSKSGYVGVAKHQKKWSATLYHKWVGVYDTKEEAARAVDRKRIELGGNLKKLNFPLETYQ